MEYPCQVTTSSNAHLNPLAAEGLTESPLVFEDMFPFYTGEEHQDMYCEDFLPFELNAFDFNIVANFVPSPAEQCISPQVLYHKQDNCFVGTSNNTNQEDRDQVQHILSEDNIRLSGAYGEPEPFCGKRDAESATKLQGTFINFALNNKTSHGVRKKRFSKVHREQTAQVRRAGACIRCRQMKRKVSSQSGQSCLRNDAHNDIVRSWTALSCLHARSYHACKPALHSRELSLQSYVLRE